MGPQGTPEAIIGLDLEGKGFDEVNQALDKHLKGWEAIEGHTTRIGQKIEGIVGSVGKLAGITSVGALVYDFMRLEDVSNRVALQLNNITGGRSGFTGTRTALQTAAIATSTDSRELGAAVASAIQRVGPGGVNVGQLATLFGTYSQAYGIDPGAVGSSAADLALFQRMNLSPQSSQQILNQVATQARKAGMAGQTGLYMSTVSDMVSTLIGSHPMAAGPGAANRVGAMYGAAVAGNPVFRDPALFGSGMVGVDQAVSQAYTNPRMAAMLNMAGISYWQARNGLAGPGGRDMASKLLGYSNRMYGSGSIEQDLFLRSNFGDVSADLLKAFSKGKITYDQLLHGVPEETRRTLSDTARRAHQSEQTAGSRAQKVREGAGKAISGPLDDLFQILDGLGLNSFSHLAEAGAGIYAGKKLGGAGLRRLFRGLKAKHATTAAGDAGDEAARQAERHLMTTSAADDVARAASAGAEVAGAGSKVLGKLGPAAAIAMFGYDMVSGHGSIHHRFDRAFNNLLFGIPDMFSENRPVPLRGRPSVPAHLRGPHSPYDVGSHGMGPDGSQAVPYDPGLMHYPDGGATTAPGRTHAAGQFSRAVDKFGKAVDQLTRQRGGMQGASYSLNSSGVDGINDAVGANMILARMLIGGGGSGGGSGTSFADYQLSAMGGGGGGGGGTGGGGASGVAAHGLQKFNHRYPATSLAHPGTKLSERAWRAIGESVGMSPREALQFALITGAAHGGGESGGHPGEINASSGAAGGLQMNWKAWGHGAYYQEMMRLGGPGALRNPFNQMRMADFMYDYEHGSLSDWNGSEFQGAALAVGHNVHAVLRRRHHKRKTSPSTTAQPQAHLAWMRGADASVAATGGDVSVTVNIDGRQQARQQRLVRGRA